jgi:Tol biopolymer transport system component/tRNA A-37 threonylcarbamoyl transferase component Bud32
MPLAVGTKLGPFEILQPVGAGGMGEVYRARDTRLGRDVAVKILPERFSQNPELKQRFEREARNISSLSHPHICALYDIGHQDGIDFLVMEFLEGETLEHILMKGPLPTEQVLRHGMEIADALEKAHRHGIVHRDLKPGNIMLTKSGAKLLDFGLAKLHVPEQVPVAAALAELATEDRTITAKGMILGTIQYMAPEQLEGKEADARTDIFALGDVLYEMATGKPPFTGTSKASLIAAIISSDPPAISGLQPMTPPALDRVVKICLAKDPDERWQTAHDLKLELKGIAEAGSQAGVPAPVVARRKLRERVAWTVAVASILGMAIFVVGYLRRAPVAPAVARFSIPAPAKALFEYPVRMAVSPDGTQFAFVAVGENREQLIFLRSLDSLTAEPLPGTQGVDSSLFWSPDSRYIGYYADGKLKKFDVAGGVPEVICETQYVGRATWNRDGVILFNSGLSGPIYRISFENCAAKPVTKLDDQRHEVMHVEPKFLPDGRRFLYVALDQGKNPTIMLASLDSSESRILVKDGFSPSYVSPGYLVFAHFGALMAQPFDGRHLRTTGAASPLLHETIEFSAAAGLASYSVSENGILTYRRQGDSRSQLQWWDRKGKPIAAVTELGTYGFPRLSPDGQKIAAGIMDPRTHLGDLWLFNIARKTWTRFTFQPCPGAGIPVWSPDSRRIVFGANRNGLSDIYLKNSDGSGTEEVLVPAAGADKTPWDWSSDGRFILFQSDEKNVAKLFVLSVEGRGRPTPLSQTQFNEWSARFSPDGRWIAYVSDESGRPEVYIRTFSAGSGKWQVSTAGGRDPQWRRDGRELFYLAAENKLMSVEINSGDRFQAGLPQVLFLMPEGSVEGLYQVSADGKRFLIDPLAGMNETVKPIDVVLNWTAALKR